MSLSMPISLFLCLLVGSLGMVLQVLVSLSNPMALSVYSCLSMMTIATPLSVVNTTLDQSSLRSLIALNSSTVMFGLVGALVFEQVAGLSPEFLCLPWGSFMHTSSMAVI